MKNSIYILLIIFISISCGSNNDKEVLENKSSAKVEQTMTETKSSADYSSLFNNYTCDLSVAEFSEATGIPVSAVEEADSYSPSNCAFKISGIGDKTFVLTLGTNKSSKANNKGEINTFLEREKKNENIMGMAIELSATGDSYITLTPHVGRVIILNENYDNVFMLSFGTRGINKRTKEQHEDLTKKLVTLANYLLKKHKK